MILFINTSDYKLVTLALVSKTKVLKKTWVSDAKISETLLDDIKNFLSKQRVTLQTLEKVAVLVGPGHFSRVRTGVVIANTLAFSLKIPVIGIKKEEFSDLKKIVEKKGQKSVKPLYDRAPNITKSSKIKIKNLQSIIG